MTGLIFANMPVPRDLMLPLPLIEAHIKILLVVFFLLHILFVNLMVGGSLLTVFFEILGLRRPAYDRLAYRIAETVTVNKSLAVVMGVGPLLCISLVYTTQFYSANALTGHAWILIVPSVTVAFLLTYLHKYTWGSWVGRAKPAHIALGTAAAVFFVLIPLIFLSNINLMLFPDKWAQVRGFFSSLRIGNVFPRYFHFLDASLSVSCFFFAGWFGRRSFDVESGLPGFTRPGLRRMFYRAVFYLTAAQFIFGPVLLLTLPHAGLSLTMIVVILAGACLAAALMMALAVELGSVDDKIGRLYWPIVGLFTVIVLLMGTGRHLYRDKSLERHREWVHLRTQEFVSIEYGAKMRIDAGLDAGRSVNAKPTGKLVFEQNCAACHAFDKTLVGPSLKEISTIYEQNASGIAVWAKAPGKKRASLGQMPSFAQLGDERLELVARYMMDVGQGRKKLNDPGEE